MKRIKYILTLSVLLSSILGMAQVSPPPPVQPPPSGPGLPIDSGILVLIIVALVLGTYFSLRQFKKNKS